MSKVWLKLTVLEADLLSHTIDDGAVHGDVAEDVVVRGYAARFSSIVNAKYPACHDRDSVKQNTHFVG